MLKQATFIACGLVVITTVVWGWSFVRVRPIDKDYVVSILEKQIQSRTDFSSVQQKRARVVKDIWLTQDDGNRLHNRIKSESSLLMLKPNGGKLQLIEELHQINCSMQERIYYKGNLPMQQVRMLEADSGEYHFAEKELLSQGVAIFVYRLSTHTLPQEAITIPPIFSGNAENASLILLDKTPDFKAKDFVAHIYPRS
jgi:hypothetical protein